MDKDWLISIIIENVKKTKHRITVLKYQNIKRISKNKQLKKIVIAHNK